MSFQEFPSRRKHRRRRNAQDAQTLDEALEFDDTLDTDADADTEAEVCQPTEEEEQTRPNRFVGYPQTWRSYTANDRQIAESLDQLTNADLAAHLYNAHALKRRVRRPAEDLAGLRSWQSRNYWLKTGKDLEYTDVSGLVQKELVPRKAWTAWPVPPAKLPNAAHRPEDRLAPGQVGGWAIRSATTNDAGEELREEMLAVFTRLAKEKWSLREADNLSIGSSEDTSMSRSRSRSKSATSTKSRCSTSRSDFRMSENDDPPDDDADDGNDDEEQQEHTSGKRRDRKARAERAETFGEPTVLADDARAQRLIQPSVQSMLSELDILALAARRTRINHLGRGGSTDRSSQSELTSGAESSEAFSTSLSSSRSRKPSARPSPRAKGQKQPPDASDDSSISDTFRNISHERKPRGFSSNTSGASSPSTTRDRSERLGLLDWSEVLGLAAVKGWDEQAIVRTAQRCTALFGESMSFTPFREDLASKPAEPVVYTPCVIPGPDVLPLTGPPSSKRPFFQVGTLRCPHVGCRHDGDFASSDRVIKHCMQFHKYDPRTNDSDNAEMTAGGEKRPFFQVGTLRCPHTGCRSHDRGFASSDRVIKHCIKFHRYDPRTNDSENAEMTADGGKRPFFQVGALCCPHTGCPGHEKDYTMPYRVVEHCIRVHKYDPRTNDSDNEERKVGGVHIDGFLQPITAKPGWLGRGRSKAEKASKKHKKGQKCSADEPESAMSIDDLEEMET
ncbi:hypothetical protein EJ02DRAFT_451930 [Clathrospora elynae]|uniref:Rrn9 domain-containing protein n=1 Tax=Clathrospora elynae TaxID=706981 RepID=A0A6A5SYY2_9PLEO|nr:hypothetical protein EJ02DRAFT_451930 [Clathrospora elynae]